MMTIQPANEFQQRVLAEKALRNSLKRGNSRLNAPAQTQGRNYLSALRARASQKGIEFDLTAEWIAGKLKLTHCEATGIEFSGKGSDTFGLTIDRKDSALGYTMANCWATCWIYNRCKLDGTHEDVIKFAQALVNRA